MEYYAPYPRMKSTIQFTLCDQKMHVCIMCLSRTVRRQHVSIAVETILMVTCENIRRANSLSKGTSEPMDATKNVLNLLCSLDVRTVRFV
jgi:hypothetical protein